MEEKRYKNPPIQEALCEIYFEPNQPWDWTIPGVIYEKVKKNYPKKKQKNNFEVQFQSNSQSFTHGMRSSINRMQFWREDNTGVIQIGEDLLSVNQLKPYKIMNE